MPSYDYRCPDCSSNITLDRSMTDESKPVCSGCGGTNLNRIWNVFIVAAGGSTPDLGQGASTSSAPRKSGCGSCSSSACGTCH